MNFEEAYKKYVEGNATEEEKKFVEEEILKSKKVFDVLEQNVILPANEDDIKKIKKKFNIRVFKTTLIVTLSTILLLTIITCSWIFGFAYHYAKKNTNLTLEEAQAIALEYVENNYSSLTTARIVKKEQDLEIKWPLKYSHYTYDIEIIHNYQEIEIVIDADTKAIIKVDLD